MIVITRGSHARLIFLQQHTVCVFFFISRLAHFISHELSGGTHAHTAHCIVYNILCVHCASEMLLIEALFTLIDLEFSIASHEENNNNNNKHKYTHT